ncbi:hypothetical protein GW915_09910 [bacterium]|nr:hypothetical protein [bacterium]
MTPFEAAQVLAQNSDFNESLKILNSLWIDCDPRDEFSIFCAMMEVSMAQKTPGIRDAFDQVISGEGEWSEFWARRTLVEQGILFEWYGELCYSCNEMGAALDSLTRAASLGRDTSNMWLHLGDLYLKNNELELSVRYLRRSLELYKQPGLDILDPHEGYLGAYSGTHPLDFNPGPTEYLGALLDVIKLAKGRRSLRSVRDLVVEMIHQFPREERLPKIRLLLERSLVNHSLQPGYPA